MESDKRGNVPSSELGEANTLKSLGDLDVREARLAEARQRYERALASFQAIGARLGEANAMQSLAMLAIQSGALGEAFERGRQAAGLSLAIGDRLGASSAFGVIGRAHMASKEPAEALPAFLKTRSLAREAGSRFNEALSLFDLAAALAASNRSEAANLVTAAGAVLGLRAGLRLPEEMQSVARRIEADGKTDELLTEVNRLLECLAGAEPEGSGDTT